MRVHHLNCGTMNPKVPFLYDLSLVCHVLLVEHEDGLVLVDSGFGTADVEDPSRIGPARHLLMARFDAAETAVAQVRRLGFDPADVRHIVVTHLDIDHCGGMVDFPDATVHLMAAEHLAATQPPSLEERMRYRAVQWAHGPRWSPHDVVDGDSWQGFDGVRPIEGLDGLLMIPLEGHTRGHAGVAVEGDDGWLLHAGDAYFHRSEMGHADGMPWPLRLFERTAAVDNEQRLANQARVRDAVASGGLDARVFSAHDPVELAAFHG